MLRDGAFIDQNNELLFLNGFGLIDVGEIIPVPSLVKERWYYRVDLNIRMQRVIQRTYPVRWLLKVQGTEQTDTGYSTVLTAG